MLPEGFKARKDVLTLNKFKAALEKINLKKTDMVELSGGEPTLNPYLLIRGGGHFYNQSQGNGKDKRKNF